MERQMQIAVRVEVADHRFADCTSSGIARRQPKLPSKVLDQ
jgi:hypothetical protein